MEIYFKKTSYGLIPLYDSDKESYDRISLDSEVKAVITKPRNYLFHKKAFALLNLAFASQDQFDVFTHFRYWITMKAGFVEVVKTGKGEFYIPKSVSFGAMDELEFADWYNAVLDQAIKLTGNTSEEIEQNLASFM